MDRTYVNRDIFDWMMGYYIILAILTASAFIPLVFLVPLFFVWRMVNIRKATFSQLIADKKMTKLESRKKRIPLTLIFFGTCVVLVCLYVLYKLYVEHYWFEYVAVPAASFLGDVFGPLFNTIFSLIGNILGSVLDLVGSVVKTVGELVDGIFEWVFFFLEDAYEWAIEVIATYEAGIEDYSFGCFVAQYIVTPLYKFFFGCGDVIMDIGNWLSNFGTILDNFFHNIVDMLGQLYHMWVGHTDAIEAEFKANADVSFFERIKNYLMGIEKIK